MEGEPSSLKLRRPREGEMARNIIKTARLQDRKTAGPQDCRTARLQD